MLNRAACIKRMHYLGRQRGFDHEAIREIASSLFAIPMDSLSLSALSDSQVMQLLDNLSGKGANRGPQPVPNAATPRQIWKIRQLADQHGMSSEALAAFIARQCQGHRDVHALRVWDAAKVIEGLKNLIAHEQEATAQ